MHCSRLPGGSLPAGRPPAEASVQRDGRCTRTSAGVAMLGVPSLIGCDPLQLQPLAVDSRSLSGGAGSATARSLHRPQETGSHTRGECACHILGFPDMEHGPQRVTRPSAWPAPCRARSPQDTTGAAPANSGRGQSGRQLRGEPRPPGRDECFHQPSALERQAGESDHILREGVRNVATKSWMSLGRKTTDSWSLSLD